MIRTLAFSAALLAAPAAIAQTTQAAPSAAQMRADQQAQYDSDVAAYRDSLRSAHREARDNDAHYQHQQRAYADAMAAWRAQVDACHHGHNRACEAPTPDPANYY